MENQKITTFLMFTGQAEEAMNFYTSLFDEAEVTCSARLKHPRGTSFGRRGLLASFGVATHIHPRRLRPSLEKV
nr:VOC family protein [Marinithermofilum abyssi]